MKIILEGARINSLDDFYDAVEHFLTVGECPWGRNLDSLDEIVQYSFNYTNDPDLNVTEIEWRDSALSANKLGKDATLLWWQQKLSVPDETTIQHWSAEQKQEILARREQIEATMNLTRKGKGQTLFEMLEDILNSNPDVTLTLA
ncbi:barstar family protein [Hymenobacter sp. AT01-02]|uniref:barstar family protein n=1 Tax=Hymenobacter sp. AT01-02 TaxID=1571877 RepID=UPI0005F25CD7|nr:barstar family protein [Hymenobacter sp. AT01-02]